MKVPTEILAPAGSMEALEAAVTCGADAVYLGADRFNARQNAANFSPDELKQAVEYCHLRQVKVHLTVNTLVRDNEIDGLLALAEEACHLGVDAFIVQDPGAARLLHEAAPDVALHASTQMSVMTAAGFEELRALGFRRVVLPRELSLREIRSIREDTGMELEMFVHGALCMCVSGQCYLSACLGGRSGNRGLCAQPCRLPFDAPHGTGHDLSLKDLDLTDRLPALHDAGVQSFKIEGRMKRPEYVAAAVTACREALEGRRDDALRADLRAVFSRSGFTDGYLTETRGVSMFGTRQKEDVTAAGPALDRLSGLYRDRARQTGPTGVALELTAHVGAPVRLRASTGRQTAEVFSAQPAEAAQSRAADRDSVRRQLKKTGGTAFTVMDTDICLDDDVFLPASELNRLRRDVLDRLSASILGESQKPFYKERAVRTAQSKPRGGDVGQHSGNAVPQGGDAGQRGEKAVPLVLRLDNIRQLPASLAGAAAVIVPLDTPEDRLTALRKTGVPFGVEIPRALYGHRGKTDNAVDKAARCGASFAYAGTLDGVVLAKGSHLPVLGGFTLNAFNAETVDVFRELGLSAVTMSQELRLLETEHTASTLPRGILAYGRAPLMMTRNCPTRNGMSCRECGRHQSLTDRKGISFPVRCCGGASDLLNSRPIWLADHLSELPPLDFLLLYFTVETAEQTGEVLSAYRLGLPSPVPFTRGLCYRGVQ